MCIVYMCQVVQDQFLNKKTCFQAFCDRWTLMLQYDLKILIENADATPPHLDVILRLGSSGDMLGFFSLWSLGSSWVCLWLHVFEPVLAHFSCWDDTFGIIWAFGRSLWEVLGSFLRPGRNNLWKVGDILLQYGRLWAPWWPPWLPWGVFFRTLTATIVPRSAQKILSVALWK